MNHVATTARPVRLLFILPLFGCSLSSATPASGVVFSGWFLCLLGGASLLIPCHILIICRGRQPRFSPPAFSYVALTFLFAMLLQFLFFVR